MDSALRATGSSYHSKMPTLDELTADPAWLPHRYDASSRSLGFIRVPKEDHRAVTFLDDQNLGERQALRIPLSELARAPLPQPEPVHFIFHSAFCCSTLVTRALDVPGRSFGLKEPRILIELAALAVGNTLPSDLLQLTLALLARRFAPGETIIVKPGNEANILAGPILEQLQSSRALLLTSPLEDFLISIAKKGMWGRSWARRLYAQMRPLERRDPGFSDAETFRQTDLQIAAMVWLMHRSQFADLLVRFPNRLASLESDRFLRDQGAALECIGKHLDVPMPSAAAAAGALANGEHSKEHGRRFNAEIRKEERDSVRSAHGEEIEMVVQWALAVAAHIGLSPDLDRPLIPA